VNILFSRKALLFCFALPSSLGCAENGEVTDPAVSPEDTGQDEGSDVHAIVGFDYGPESIVGSLCQPDCVLNERQEFTYDDKGRLLSHVYYEYLSDEWQEFWRIDYTYEPTAMKKRSTWRGEETWSEEHELGDDGQIISTQYDDGRLHKTSYIYDDDGRLSRKETVIESEGEWAPERTTIYEYDDSNRLVIETKKEHDDSNDRTRRELTYDAQGRVSEFTDYGSSGDTPWEAKRRGAFYYCSGGNQLETATVELMVENAWEQTGSVEFGVDADGRLMRSSSLILEGDLWGNRETDYSHTDAGSSLTWEIEETPLMAEGAALYGYGPVNIHR
jgi:hypothetical protein